MIFTLDSHYIVLHVVLTTLQRVASQGINNGIAMDQNIAWRVCQEVSEVNIYCLIVLHLHILVVGVAFKLSHPASHH